MKRTVWICGIVCVMMCVVMSSCASLQEDIFVKADEKDFVYQSVEEYENRFIKIDSEIRNGKNVSNAEIDALINDIDKQLSGHVETDVGARLNAFKGLLYNMEGKTKKANDAYATAKSLQAGDNYVLLLNSRLQKTNEAALAVCDEVLSYSPNNPTMLLEKGLLLYKENKFTEAVASIDNAFILFDREGKKIYRDTYSNIRNSIWNLRENGVDLAKSKISDIADLGKPLTKEKMIELTVSNSSLLEGFLGGEKMNTSSLLKKLETAGYFSAAGDQANREKTSADITSSNEISRILCARFLWNLYIHKTGNTKLLTAYSNRYSKLSNAKSPVPDIAIDSQDFDAVLGVIEKEIMSLPDGKRFYGNGTVTALEFLGFIKKCDAQSK